MIIKFFNQGTHTAKNIIGYLQSKEKHPNADPEVVKGSSYLTEKITDGISRKYKYQTGVISFSKGENLSHKKQLDLIGEFERTFAPFDEEDRANFLWVRHVDKGRLELHFVCPMIDLKTKKQLNISPPGKPNQMFYREFVAKKNHEYGFEQITKKQYSIDDYKQSCNIVNDMVDKRVSYFIDYYRPKTKTKKGLSNGRRYSNNNKSINPKLTNSNNSNRKPFVFAGVSIKSNTELSNRLVEQSSKLNGASSKLASSSLSFEKGALKPANRKGGAQRPHAQSDEQGFSSQTAIGDQIGQVSAQISSAQAQMMKLPPHLRASLANRIAELLGRYYALLEQAKDKPASPKPRI